MGFEISDECMKCPFFKRCENIDGAPCMVKGKTEMEIKKLKDIADWFKNKNSFRC